MSVNPKEAGGFGAPPPGYGYETQPQGGVYPQVNQGYAAGAPPVVQQPGVMHSGTHTTVVVNQMQQRQVRNWTQGTCGCFDDCGTCVCVTFCIYCAACQMAQDMGEFVCMAFCVPNWLTAARTKVRTQLGIPGSICDDCCMASFCGACTMCQVWREVKEAKNRGEM